MINHLRRSSPGSPKLPSESGHFHSCRESYVLINETNQINQINETNQTNETNETNQINQINEIDIGGNTVNGISQK